MNNKKSRIIVNNWSSISDRTAMNYVGLTLERERTSSGTYPTIRYLHSDGAVIVAAFRNKHSDSFDIRDFDRDDQNP